MGSLSLVFILGVVGLTQTHFGNIRVNEHKINKKLK